MSTTELVKLSAAEMAAKIKAKEVSSRELVEAHLAVIESAEPSVKAFLKVSADQALEQADAFDDHVLDGDWHAGEFRHLRLVLIGLGVEGVGLFEGLVGGDL